MHGLLPPPLNRGVERASQQERGKFCWFLLSALKRFLANEWNREHAAKRGGRHILVSLDEQTALLGMNEGAVKVAIHRLRQRYRECLREQIALTVSTPPEVDEEIQQLFAAFGG
jgi:hypothetical protein